MYNQVVGPSLRCPSTARGGASMCLPSLPPPTAVPDSGRRGGKVLSPFRCEKTKDNQNPSLPPRGGGGGAGQF